MIKIFLIVLLAFLSLSFEISSKSGIFIPKFFIGKTVRGPGAGSVVVRLRGCRAGLKVWRVRG